LRRKRITRAAAVDKIFASPFYSTYCSTKS
jgi:hypothetical protein